MKKLCGGLNFLVSAASIMTLFSLVFFSQAQAQSASSSQNLQIRGQVIGPDQRGIPGCMVVNRSTGAGRFGSAEGRYAWTVRTGDTLHFGAIGFHTAVRIAGFDITDSTEQIIELRPLQVALATAEIIAPRTLRQIVEDIETLGYKEQDYRTSGVDAFQSPITFLYEQFSRRERSIRQVIRMENDDRRRALLKELLMQYVDYDIVELSSEEFDNFIDFVDPGDDLLQALTQYEFILWTRERFIAWQLQPAH
jgi:hypothetical protein